MGFYHRYILPHLTNYVMQNALALAERQYFIPQARGKVLEIGIGSGLNIPLYTSQVEYLYGLDPSRELWALARQRCAQAAFAIEYLACSAESIPCADATFDTVVSTWTLCSIPDPLQALQEIRRVLKPQGRMIFIEHGQAPDSGVRIWQNRINPLWRRLAGGCNLNRPVQELIRQAGFVLAHYTTGYLPGPKPFGYLYKGFAHPVAS